MHGLLGISMHFFAMRSMVDRSIDSAALLKNPFEKTDIDRPSNRGSLLVIQLEAPSLKKTCSRIKIHSLIHWINRSESEE